MEIVSIVFRGVAQSGSALGWGSSGRRFKSCHPDKKGVNRHQNCTNLMKTKDLYFPWFHLNSFDTKLSETYSVTYYFRHRLTILPIRNLLFKAI